MNNYKNKKSKLVFFLEELKDWLYLYTYSNKKKVIIRKWDHKAHDEAIRVIELIKKVIPDKKIYFTGSLALKIDGEQDADIFIECLPSEFDDVIPKLTRIFGSEYKRRSDSVEWHVVLNGVSIDLFVSSVECRPFRLALKVFNILDGDKNLLAEYSELKNSSNGKTIREYQKKKMVFLNRICSMDDRRAKLVISSYDSINNPIYGGGGAIAVQEVAKRLQGSYDVVVVSANHPGEKFTSVDGVSYKYIGLGFLNGPLGQLIYHLVLPWYALFMNYDLFIESFTPPFSTSFVPLFTGRPVIGLVHMLSGRDMYRKYHIPFKVIEDFGLKLYKSFIVLTKNSEDEIRLQNTSAQVRIIGNGVYSPQIPNTINQGKHIGYIGRIEIDQKGLDLLLKVYANVYKDIKMPLVIAGTGSENELNRLKKMIEILGLKDHVSLSGRVDGVEKESFFRNTYVGLMPSRYETFSLVTLEMLSYGIPVLSFDIPGLKWAPDSIIAKVEAFRVDLMSKRLIDLVNNNLERELISKNARLYVSDNSWDNVAIKYSDFISDLISNK